MSAARDNTTTARDDADATPSSDTTAAGARARDGLEHLQIAARELIQAARAMLDVAEELVNDPETVASMVGTLGSLADAAARAVPGMPPRRRAGHGGGEDDGDDEPIQRIRVS